MVGAARINAGFYGAFNHAKKGKKEPDQNNGLLVCATNKVFVCDFQHLMTLGSVVGGTMSVELGQV